MSGDTPKKQCPQCDSDQTEYFLKSFLSNRIYYWCHGCKRAFSILDEASYDEHGNRL